MEAGDTVAHRTDVVSINSRKRHQQSRTPDSEMYDSKLYYEELGQIMAFLSYLGFAPHIADEAAAFAVAEAWERNIAPPVVRDRWLRTTAKRAAIRLVKDNPAARLQSMGYKPANANQDGTEMYRFIEQHSELVHAMQSLPVKQRSVMALHVIGVEPKEISEELHIPLSTTYGLIDRARTHLRAIIIPVDPKEGSK